MPLLKDHVISRLTGRVYDGDEHEYTPEERDRVIFLHNRLYRHKVLRVNYTTYDMRRDQDSVNPRTHPDIMMLAYEDDDNPSALKHPYWYARVIGIFHTTVKYTGPGAVTSDWEHVEFLWVRWYGQDPEARTGFAARRLPRIGFVQNSSDEPGAFGFVDPTAVIRAAHLIPAFHFAHRDDLLGPSRLARGTGDEDEDFTNYYVNM